MVKHSIKCVGPRILFHINVFITSSLPPFYINNTTYITSNVDAFHRCRWSINSGEPALFVKYGTSKLNVLDAEKKTLTLKNEVELDDCN